jgi:hypothetical protein
LDAWLKNDKFGIEEPSSWHKENAKNYQRLTLNQVYEINLIELRGSSDPVLASLFEEKLIRKD